MTNEEEQKTIEQLEAATKTMNEATAQLKSADKCFNTIVKNSSPENQQKTAMLVNKVKQLLARVKAEENVDDIVKEINKLR
tara:strand:+ start:286 stop:528 length:243 start_codon:yes stop_codon:yes gene_type:complete